MSKRNRLYDRWYDVMRRCYDLKHKYFLDYGGRGIDVYGPWHDFEIFKRDNQMPRDTSLEIDREDVNKGYWPGNVRWVTKQVNMANRRSWNKSGLPRGVRIKASGVIYSQINHRGKNYFLGKFDSVENASQAFNQAFFKFNGFLPQGVIANENNG